MTVGCRTRISALFAAATVLAAAPSAEGAVTIGSNLGREPNTNYLCNLSGCTAFQGALPADSQAAGGLVSPINGTVTVWRIRTTSFGNTPAALRIIRPLAGNLFTGAGTSTVVTPPPSATTPFSTQLPIAIGDRIGLDFTDANYYVTNTGATRSFFDPPLADGSAGTAPNGTMNNREITINADIEPTSTFAVNEVKPGKAGKVTVTATLPNAGTLVAGDVRDTALAAAAAKKKTKYLKRSSVQIGAPGTASLQVNPTKAGRRALALHPRVKGKLKLAFTPTGGSASTQTIKVKLKR